MKKDFGVHILMAIKEAKIFLIWQICIMLLYYFSPDAFQPIIWWLLFLAYTVIIFIVGVQSVSLLTYEKLHETYKKLVMTYEEQLLAEKDHISLALKLIKASAFDSAASVLESYLSIARESSNQIKIKNNTEENGHVH
jgi:hypothetical protein